MAPSKSKLLAITLVLLFFVGIATVILILSVTKKGAASQDNNLNVTDAAANIYQIQDSDSITASNNNSFYHVDTTASTSANDASTAYTTRMSSKTTLLDASVCRLRVDHLSKAQCPTKSNPRNDAAPFSTASKLSSLHEILNYDVHLQISRKDENILEGSSKTFMKINQKTDKIVLHADRQIADIVTDSISVYQCATGNEICINSIARQIDSQLLIITLTEAVNIDEMLIVDISHFESVIPNNQALFRDFRDNSWMIGTLFEKVGAKNVFPCIDERENRATLNLCLSHPQNVISKANMPVKAATATAQLMKTCFEQTPAIPSYQYGFVLFDNMHLVTHNGTNQVIEVYIGKHLKHSDLGWIFNEIETVFNKMTEITGRPFPAPKLTVVSSFIDMEATHSLGLIVLKETWFEYPKYKVTYINLVRQVVGQWISSILTVCSDDYPMFCAQEGLATFLEWTITAEFKSINISAESRFEDARQLALSSSDEKKLGFISGNSLSECSDRAAIVFYVLHKHSGKEALQRFWRNMFSIYGEKKCASIEEVGQALRQATNSDIPRDIFVSYAKSKAYPLIKVKHLPDGHLTMTQETVHANDSTKFTLPIDLFDNSLRSSQHIINQTPVHVHKPANFLVVDPDMIAYQRTIYNIESYTNILQCMHHGKSCPIKSTTLKNIFSDMCWGLLENRLESDQSRALTWHQMFKQLIQNGSDYLNDICSCCMKSRSQSTTKCKWTWKDKCSRLILADSS